MSSLFGAAWTLGSLKYLSEASAASITYYEAFGKAGLVTGADAVNSLYHVLADVTEFSGGEVIETGSSDKFKAVALLLTNGIRKRGIVANLTPEVQVIRWSKAGFGPRVRLKSLDEHSFAEATSKAKQWRLRPGRMTEMDEDLEIALLPYAVVRVDPVL